jgi:hypothetical protein
MDRTYFQGGLKQIGDRPWSRSGVIVGWLALLLLIMARPLPADAACSNSDQCSSDTVCIAPKFPIGLPKECRPMPCNFDTECPSARPKCLMGICQNPGFNPNTPPGTGTTQAGVGEACGPYKIGQVTKSRGCKPGLQCVKGHCQQPAR